jgi:hypothetical protein
MAKIVHPGAVSAPAVGDAGLPEEPAEVLVDVAEGERLARPAAGEEPLSPDGPLGGPGVVVGEPFV